MASSYCPSIKAALAGVFFVLLAIENLAAASADAPVVHWKPEADMDHQLFPALVIATATRHADADDTPNPDLLGDHRGLLGISIRSSARKTQVKVTVRETALFDTSVWSGTLVASNHTYFVAPQIAYKYDAVRRVRQQAPLTVLFDLEVNGQSAGTQSETITLRCVNDCPFAVADDEDDVGDDEVSGTKETNKAGSLHGDSDSALGWMFAAYVNEGHPIIDVLLKEALHTGIINNVDGYQDADPAEVLRQVYAVWKVLQDRGVRYSDISTNAGGSERVSSQYVRFVDESLRHEQANCVDGSVLFASILRKMGLAPFLVVVPGHMYLGVALSNREDDDTVACIETTLIGAGAMNTSLKTVKEISGLEKSLDATAKANPAWKSFKNAVCYATAAYHRDESKFADDDNADYQLIDVAQARADGIMPIPFDRPQHAPELPGGPSHMEPPTASARPLPTPFVKPPSSPAPKETPAPAKPAPEQSPADTPVSRPKPTPKKQATTGIGGALSGQDIDTKGGH